MEPTSLPAAGLASGAEGPLLPLPASVGSPLLPAAGFASGVDGTLHPPPASVVPPVLPAAVSASVESPFLPAAAPASGASLSAPAASDSASLSSASLLYSGAEPPPRPAVSTKTDNAGCKACLRNLRKIRTDTNRQFAMRKVKRNRPKVSDRPAPQHNYNTRARKRQKHKQKTHTKRKRPVSPPLQGPEILGVNFPT